MNEEEAKKVLKNMDINENGAACNGCIFGNDTPCLRNGKDCQIIAIDTVLQLLEQKDKRIDDLEKALVEEAIKSTEKIKQLNSGINKLMAKRKKWKNRYYKNKTKVYKLKKKIKEDKEKMQTYYDEIKFDYYNKIDELLKILEE